MIKPLASNTACSRQGVCVAFSSIFLALSLFRFGGESRPAHLPLTQTVRRIAKMKINLYNKSQKIWTSHEIVKQRTTERTSQGIIY